MDVPDFQQVLAEGRALQARLAELSPVAVGGTAAALHCQRRFSLDVDVAALARRLGREAAPRALRVFNLVYGPRAPQTWVSAFAEACEAEPIDAAAVPLAAYKGLRAPFTDGRLVADECRKLGRDLVKLELDGALPSALPTNWPQGEQP